MVTGGRSRCRVEIYSVDSPVHIFNNHFNRSGEQNALLTRSAWVRTWTNFVMCQSWYPDPRLAPAPQHCNFANYPHQCPEMWPAFDTEIILLMSESIYTSYPCKQPLKPVTRAIECGQLLNNAMSVVLW